MAAHFCFTFCIIDLELDCFSCYSDCGRHDKYKISMGPIRIFGTTPTRSIRGVGTCKISEHDGTCNMCVCVCVSLCMCVLQCEVCSSHFYIFETCTVSTVSTVSTVPVEEIGP